MVCWKLIKRLAEDFLGSARSKSDCGGLRLTRHRSPVRQFPKAAMARDKNKLSGLKGLDLPGCGMFTNEVRLA